MPLCRFSWTLLLALAWSSTSLGDDSEAPAGDEPLAILGIVSGNRDQAEALTTALKRTLDASIEWKNLELGADLSKWTAAAGCPESPDAACLSRIASNARVTRFVWGRLVQRQSRVTAQLSLYDAHSPGVTAQLEYSSSMIDTFDENLLRLANRGLVQLLGAIHFPVTVRSRESKGTLVVDDVVVGSLEDGAATIGIPAGDHRFRLVLPDGTIIARTFQVRVARANQLRLDFITIPES